MNTSYWRDAIRLAAVLLGLIAPARAAADTRPLPHYIRYDQLEMFTSEDGLSQNTVRCILQDRTGFLWFGTDDGLSRFDGYKFHSFRGTPDIPAGLPHNRITALYQDQSGRMWAGAMGGLFRFDPDAGSFAPFSLALLTSTQEGPAVWQIHESPLEAGVLWVATSAGLYRAESQTSHSRKIEMPPGGRSPAPRKSCPPWRKLRTGGCGWDSTPAGWVGSTARVGNSPLSWRSPTDGTDWTGAPSTPLPAAGTAHC